MRHRAALVGNGYRGCDRRLGSRSGRAEGHLTMRDPRFGVFIIMVAGLAWAVFDCWRHGRYPNAVAVILGIFLSIGFAALAFYEAKPN